MGIKNFTTQGLRGSVYAGGGISSQDANHMDVVLGAVDALNLNAEALQVFEIAMGTDNDFRVIIIEIIMKKSSPVRKTRKAFSVNRAVLMAGSDYFAKRLQNSMTSKELEITVTEGTTKSMEFWFRHLHETKAEEMDKIITSVQELDDFMEACIEYQFHHEDFDAWFGRWFEKSAEENCRLEEHPQGIREWLISMLAPTYFFTHVYGFTAATQMLVYTTEGRTKQELQQGLSEYALFIPHSVTDQLFNAMSTMANFITKIVADETQFFFFHKNHENCKSPWYDPQMSKCLYEKGRGSWRTDSCRVFALQNYQDALIQTQVVYPISVKNGLSINEVVAGLKQFKYVPPKESCQTCCEPIDKNVILPLSDYISTYFNGLCLDCIRNCKGKDLRWFKNEGKRHTCGHNHGQASYWFSFQARKAVELGFESDKAAREAQKGETLTDFNGVEQGHAAGHDNNHNAKRIQAARQAQAGTDFNDDQQKHTAGHNHHHDNDQVPTSGPMYYQSAAPAVAPLAAKDTIQPRTKPQKSNKRNECSKGMGCTDLDCRFDRPDAPTRKRPIRPARNGQ